MARNDDTVEASEKHVRERKGNVAKPAKSFYYTHNDENRLCTANWPTREEFDSKMPLHPRQKRRHKRQSSPRIREESLGEQLSHCDRSRVVLSGFWP